LSTAHGRVLEVGAGTGTNLGHYGRATESVTLTEPEAPMLKRLRKRAGQAMPQAVVIEAPAEHLPFDDDSFDTVVCTLVLCTTADPSAALSEISRVLRPGGRLLFIEHVRSDDARLARRQDRMNRLNRFVAHGCNCNRPTVATIQGGGFDVTRLDRADLDKAPSWLRPLVVGTATAR
jgi:ubiquinone/menaquinone biosynthesis C-methylase UbiE